MRLPAAAASKKAAPGRPVRLPVREAAPVRDLDRGATKRPSPIPVGKPIDLGAVEERLMTVAPPAEKKKPTPASSVSEAKMAPAPAASAPKPPPASSSPKPEVRLKDVDAWSKQRRGAKPATQAVCTRSRRPEGSRSRREDPADWQAASQTEWPAIPAVVSSPIDRARPSNRSAVKVLERVAVRCVRLTAPPIVVSEKADDPKAKEA